MHRQFLLRTGFIAALAIGTIAGSVASSFAATSNPGAGNNSGPSGPSHGSGPSNPGGGGGNGGSGAGMPDAVRIVGPNDCPPSIAGCGHRKPRPPVVRIKTKFVDQQRCTNAWRLVELEDGTILEDRSQPMRKNCRIIRTFD